MRFWRNNKLKFILSTAVIILILAPIIAGCTSTGSVARGWSGAAITDSKIFIGSLAGQLVGLEEANGNRLFNDLSLETGTSGGLLGCGAAPITVAIYGTPVVSGNQVFAAGYNGKVYSVDATKGIKGWSFQPERGLQPIIGGLTISGNSLYFGTAKGYLYSVDITNGSQTWESKTGNKISATPLVDNGIVYIGSFDKNLYAIDAATGAKKWYFEASGSIVSTPVLQNNVLYFGTLNREFYAVNATTGNLKWKSSVTADNWYWANPIVINNVVYAPNMDGKVYLFNADNGQNITDPLDTGSPVSSSPVIFNNNIILAGEDGRVWVLDTGKNILSQLTDKSLGKIYAPLSISNGIIYVHTQSNMLYAVKADTGVVLWNKSLAG
jgi:outer membrane protein assembly factor BamB